MVYLTFILSIVVICSNIKFKFKFNSRLLIHMPPMVLLTIGLNEWELAIVERILMGILYLVLLFTLLASRNNE